MEERPKIKILKKGIPKKDIPTAPRPDPKQSILEEDQHTNPPATEENQSTTQEAPQTETVSTYQVPKKKKKNKSFNPVYLFSSYVGVIALGLLLGYFIWGNNSSGDDTTSMGNSDNDLGSRIHIPEFVKIAKAKSFYEEKDILRDNVSFSQLLRSKNVPNADIGDLNRMAVSAGIGSLFKGDKITSYYDSIDNSLKYLVVELERDPYNFLAFTLDEALDFEKTEKFVEIRDTSTAAIVQSNLAQTFNKNKLDQELVDVLEAGFKWTFDFHYLSDGDRFKLIYEREFINGNPGKIRRVKAMYFEVGKEKYYAINYGQGNQDEYFDELGKQRKASFIQSPIAYGFVISSGFGLRNHPVEGFTKLHRGTDYACPVGTPIQSVADGVVTAATFGTKAGYYIKIQHSNGRETKYMHLSRFHSSIVKGSRVRQGQEIGYVGNTGSSTGPHLHFEFWINNEPIDHLKQKVSSSNYMPSYMLEEYRNEVVAIKEKIDRVSYF